MFEELQKKTPVPSNADLENLKATMMEAALKGFSDKEITKEDLFGFVPELAELKKTAERERSLPPQHVGAINRKLLLATLEATSNMYPDASRQNPVTVSVIIGEQRIFSSAKVDNLKRSM